MRRKFAIITGYLDNYIALAEHTVDINKVGYCKRHGYSLFRSRTIRPQYQDPQSHASGHSWSRMHDMMDIANTGEFDWIWCVGCDTLITNMTITLDSIVDLAETEEAERLPLPRMNRPEELKIWPESIINYVPPPGHPATGRKHLIICGERMTPLQADSFMVRCSPEGVSYLADILSTHELYRRHVWVENQAMIDLLHKHAALTCIVPQWRMNSYDYRRFYYLHPAYRDCHDCYGNRGQWMRGDFLIHWPAASLEDRLNWVVEYSKQIIN